MGYPSIKGCIHIYWGTPVHGSASPYTGVPQWAYSLCELVVQEIQLWICVTHFDVAVHIEGQQTTDLHLHSCLSLSSHFYLCISTTLVEHPMKNMPSTGSRLSLLRTLGTLAASRFTTMSLQLALRPLGYVHRYIYIYIYIFCVRIWLCLGPLHNIPYQLFRNMW
jgi:hypothetical protein